MITTSLKVLLKNNIIALEDEDPEVFDSYVVTDEYQMQAELEPNYWGEVACIQRVLDGDNPDHLIVIDSQGNSTNVGSDKCTIRLYVELDEDYLL